MTLADKIEALDAPSREVDALDAIRRAREVMRDMPKDPFLARWSLLPSDAAISFEVDGRQFVGAHPILWEKIDETTPAQRIDGTLRPIFGVTIHNLDLNREMRVEFAEKMAAALRARGDG